jgi:hypothetical protein
LTIRIYAAEHDLTPLWEESQTITPQGNGQYTVLVGASREEGIPLDVFRSGEARWIGVTLERVGEVEAPRTRLASVPYALRAQDAETLGGHPASAYVRTRDAAARDDATASDAPEAVLPGTINMLAKYTTGADVGNSAVFENAGLVGVNTLAPRDAMHVQFTNTVGSMTGYAVQNLGNTAASYSGMLFFDQNGVLGQFQGFNNVTHEYRINNIARNGASQFDGTINFMIGSTSRLFVTSNGNVGLGTTTPSQRLHVAGALNVDGALFQNGVSQLRTDGGNVSLGQGAMSDMTSPHNVALGPFALQNLTSGTGTNVAIGYNALGALTGGEENIAIGPGTLAANQGIGNIALGVSAGDDKTTGVGNMYLGYLAGVGRGTVTESNTVRIADSGVYNRVFLGAIRGVTTGVSNAVAVVIDGDGQLGTVNSSRRYKEDIQDMGDTSSGLMKLRPVTFRYTQPYADGSRPVDYGLIAEEVKEIYPNLVAHLANGEVETVQYHKINAMLLNEVQKQHRQLQEQKRRLEAQQQDIDTLLLRLAALERAMAGSR